MSSGTNRAVDSPRRIFRLRRLGAAMVLCCFALLAGLAVGARDGVDQARADAGSRSLEAADGRGVAPGPVGDSAVASVEGRLVCTAASAPAGFIRVVCSVTPIAGEGGGR